MQISGYGSAQACSSMQQMRQKPDPQEIYQKADSDGSGGVSADEFSYFVSSMQEKMKGQAPEGMEPPEGMEAPPEMTAEQIEEMFAEADSDGNGELSEEEFAQHMESMRPQRPPMNQGENEEDIQAQVNSVQDSTISTLLDVMEASNNSDEDSDTDTLVDYLKGLIEKTYNTGSYSSGENVSASA